MKGFKQFMEEWRGMRVRIRDKEYEKHLKDYAGQWLPVETEHLFGDQFNTGPPSNARAHIRNVSDIENDIRPRALKCLYCGLTEHDKDDSEVGKDCPRCEIKYADSPMHIQSQDMMVMDRLIAP